MISRDLKVFEPTGLKGDDVSAAPDRKTLAYFRGDRMWIYQDGAEASFNLIGPTQSNPIWSQDVQMMIFDTITERGTEIIRSGIGTRLIDGVNSATRMSNVFVPPIFDPMTGNLLLAVSQTGKKTEFTTVDPLCVEDECQQTRSLGTVPYEVTSISFLPDGSAIAFSEKSGNIYLFSISTGNVSPLIVNKTHKSRIAVSGDGSRIAYLDDLQQLYILNLKDKSIKSYSGLKVQNMNWLR